MRRNLLTLTLVVLSFAGSRTVAQDWLKAVPQKAQRELTIEDYKRAFEAHFKEHPVDLSKDKVQPTFQFEGAEEVKARMDIEEYKLFSRFLWLIEPRTYPTGKLDFEKIDAIRKELPKIDNGLVLKQQQPNPLNLKIRQNRILWPLQPFWRPLGPSDAVGGTNLGRVNAILFDPKNPKTIYIGTPDGGVWKTINFGSTWTPKFDSQPTLSVGSIVIDPNDSKILYVATSDPFGYGTPFWGGTYSVGVRKSMDGGNTWTSTGLTWTVSQNRTNVAYVTTTQVLKSTNAGTTFNPLTASCAGSRYSIAVARTNPNVLYTLCASGAASVQKSVNAGATWTTVTAPGVSLYGYYDTVLAVSPINENDVYVAGFNIMHTTNGGSTWSGVPVAGHVDNHAITFLPGSGSTLLVGNDGGLFRSTNSGATWTSLNKTLSITQFYSLGISKTDPNIMVLGAQDNGNMKYSAGMFSNITNADGMKGFIDWNNSNNIYASVQNGDLYRSTNGGASFTGISTPSSGAWVTPWLQDPVTTNTIYAGTNKVYKSTNQGTTWNAISGTLAGIGSFIVLKVAPSNQQYIYAGSGTKLYRTQNGGAAWTDITAGLPVGTNYLTDLAVNDVNPQRVYVTFSGYNAGQKVYKTSDGGSTWTNISGSLPNMPANAIVHENAANNPLYIGTDAGVYYINDGLTDWVPYKYGLPNVIVDHLEIHYGTKVIRAATYGRGAWQAPLK